MNHTINERENMLLQEKNIRESAEKWWLQEPDAAPKKRRKRNGAGLPALALAACVTASGLFGFAGGYASNQLSQSGSAGASKTQGVTQIAMPTIGYETLSTSTGSTMTVPQVAASAKNSVVEITTETVATNGRMGQMISEGAGSGVIISADGYIVTNNHVIDGARSITVRLASGTEYAATLVGTDTQTDLAVIQIEASGLTAATLGDSSNLAVGETMVAIGNPLGELGGTVTSGILSALDREITIDGQSMRLLQTDTAINPGNSGGGLFNLKGELVGVVNAKSSGTDLEGLGFAIPVNTAKSVIDNIVEYGYVKGRVDAGITTVEITTNQMAMLYRVSKAGLYISASTNSQLQSGDLITAVGTAQVTGLQSYNQALADYQVGDAVTFTVTRGGQSIAVEVVLQEKKA